MQALEYNLCKAFSGFNLFNLDETDIETLIPFIEYMNLKNSKGTVKHGNIKYVNGKPYRKVNASASWAKNLF